MNKYYGIENKVVHAAENGYITFDDAENMLTDIAEAKSILGINYSDDNIFLEKKTRDEYRLEKFKKENNFVPDKTRGGKSKYYGTITTKDGEKIKVDLDYKKPNMSIKAGYTNSDPQETVRYTGADITTNVPKVHIDKSWMKVKNKNERQALFDHEIGHIKLHNFGYMDDPNNKLYQRDSVTESMIVEIFKDFARKMIPNIDDTSDEFVKVVIDEYKNIAKDVVNKWKEQNSEQRQKSLLYGMNKSKSIARENFRKYSKKYTTDAKNNGHNNTTELEADAYSINKNGSKTLNRALKHYVKNYRKSNEPSDEIGKMYFKQSMKNTEKENQLRKKASHDENLRKYAQKAFK